MCNSATKSGTMLSSRRSDTVQGGIPGKWWRVKKLGQNTRGLCADAGCLTACLSVCLSALRTSITAAEAHLNSFYLYFPMFYQTRGAFRCMLIWI